MIFMGSHIPPPIRRRVEGYRWIRSDGKPNWNQAITSKIGEVLLIASKPALTISKDSTVMELAELIATRNVRGVPVVESSGKIAGVITGTDLVNYLGGGTLFDIVAERYNYRLYDALKKERLESLIYKKPVVVRPDYKLDEVLRVMVEHGVGFIPIVDEENNVLGVITEHDLVKHLAEKSVGRTVAEVMSKTVIGIEYSDTLWNAMKLMVKYGFRRLPVFREEKLEGFVTAKIIVSFFGSHKAFEYIRTGDIREVLETPLREVYAPLYVYSYPNEDVGEAVTKMIKHGMSGIPVVEDDTVVGIITERDALYALVTR